MLRDKAVLPFYKDQEEFLENPAVIFSCINNNEVSKLIIDELVNLPNNFSSKQPDILANNMKGKILSAKNFIKKIIMDYTTSVEDFRKFYKPNLSTHLTNFLLDKKILYKDECYNIIDYEPDKLYFFILAYRTIKGLTGRAEIKMDIGTLIGKIMTNDTGTLEINENNYKNVEHMYLNLFDYTKKKQNSKKYYVKVLENNAKLIDPEEFKYQNDDTWKKNYIKIYFSKQ